MIHEAPQPELPRFGAAPACDVTVNAHDAGVVATGHETHFLRGKRGGLTVRLGFWLWLWLGFWLWLWLGFWLWLGDRSAGITGIGDGRGSTIAGGGRSAVDQRRIAGPDLDRGATRGRAQGERGSDRNQGE
ncbi:hypothetical protein WMF11_31365 [Sorangium sp. So ce295]|uniref:hypothetical protein n=1 Tax=Sorangium sp. So ce295 TaxID=3133295 RepID=UPI003F5F72CE